MMKYTVSIFFILFASLLVFADDKDKQCSKDAFGDCKPNNVVCHGNEEYIDGKCQLTSKEKKDPGKESCKGSDDYKGNCKPSTVVCHRYEEYIDGKCQWTAKGKKDPGKKK